MLMASTSSTSELKSLSIIKGSAIFSEGDIVGSLMAVGEGSAAMAEFERKENKKRTKIMHFVLFKYKISVSLVIGYLIFIVSYLYNTTFIFRFLMVMLFSQP